MTIALRQSGSRRGSLVMSISSLANGLINAAILAIAAREGQTEEIASYTVVSATLALVAVAISGGATLLYVTGSEPERRAVYSQRLIFVVPALSLGVLGIGAIYAGRGYQWLSILAAGVAVVGNNFAELQYGDLTREMRFLTSAVIACGCKVPTVILTSVGVRLTAGLGAAALVQFLALELVRGGYRCRKPLAISLREALRAFSINRVLFGYGLAELYNGRAPSLVVSFTASPKVMGCFGAVSGAHQAFAAVLYAGLQAPMASRARVRLGLDSRSGDDRGAELLSVLGASAVGALVMGAAPWIATKALRLPIVDAAEWLRILAVALPFIMINRAVTTSLIGTGRHRRAMTVATLIAALLTLGLATTVAKFGPSGAVVSILVAECLVTLILCAAYFQTRRATFSGGESG